MLVQVVPEHLVIDVNPNNSGDGIILNRIIEVDNQPAPNTTEIVNATQRVDDATVAIRASINNLANELVL